MLKRRSMLIFCRFKHHRMQIIAAVEEAHNPAALIRLRSQLIYNTHLSWTLQVSILTSPIDRPLVHVAAVAGRR